MDADFCIERKLEMCDILRAHPAIDLSASDLARNGWTIVLEYVDHETGKIPDRPQFQHMFRDASQRKSEVLLSWVARLAQSGRRSAHVAASATADKRRHRLPQFHRAVLRLLRNLPQRRDCIVTTVAKQECIRILGVGEGRLDDDTQQRQAAGPSSRCASVDYA